MHRFLRAPFLTFTLTLALAPALALGLEPGSIATGGSRLDGRLEVAKTLLARSGIAAELADDPASVRALVAAFRAWEANGEGGSPAEHSCVIDAERPTSRPAPLSLRHMLPDPGSRFGRALTFSLELQDVQDAYLVEAPNEATTDPDDKILRTVVNRDSYIPTTTVVFRPGDLLLSSSDLAFALEATAKYPKFFDNSVAINPDSRTFRSFGRSLRAGPRLLSALTLAASVSQRPTSPGGTDVPKELLREDGTATTWSVKFDPYLFFNPLAARKASYDAALGYGKLFGVQAATRGPDPCDPSQIMQASSDSRMPELCLAALSQPSPWLASLLPMIELKSVDQFDYVRAGGQYLPTTEGDLETLALTWDVSRVLSLPKARETALAVYKAHRDLQAVPPHIKAASAKLAARKGSFFHHRLEVEDGLKDFTWRVVTPDGKKRLCAFPGVQLTGDGVLLGTPEVEGSFTITVAVSDGMKQEATQTFEVVVERGAEADVKDRLLAKYLELAVRPEAIADDAWFEGLVRAWEELNGSPAQVATTSTAGSAH